MLTGHYCLIMLTMMNASIVISAEDANELQNKTIKQPRLSTGIPVAVDELEAVGTIPGCSATLITQNLVLTAAHCVCTTAADGTHNCNNRSTFTLKNVYPVDDPATSADESLQRADISIPGHVRVHPEYELRGWQREDIAVLELDYPASQAALNVTPLPVENPEVIPNPGDTLTLVGYGSTGSGCGSSNQDRLKMELPVQDSMWGGIKFVSSGNHTCPGDSGGPLLNARNRVVGVASWGNFTDESTYRPTSFSYSWIFSLPQRGWDSCQWVEVGPQKSHNTADNWCPEGSFLTQFDLDGDRTVSEYDSPVVGRAKCCRIPGYESGAWSQCSWISIDNSHQRTGSWCPLGSFMTQFDLDGDRSFSPQDAPDVGQVKCCRIQGAELNAWGSCYWKDVGDVSHQQGSSWGPEWGFLTAFDQDSPSNISAHDSPLIGQAMFCDLGLEMADLGPGTIDMTDLVIKSPMIELQTGQVFAVNMRYVTGTANHFTFSDIRQVQRRLD